MVITLHAQQFPNQRIAETPVTGVMVLNNPPTVECFIDYDVPFRTVGTPSIGFFTCRYHKNAPHRTVPHRTEKPPPQL
jgi:hypothetical protein